MPIIYLSRTMLDTDTIRYLTESGTLGMRTMLATLFRLVQVLPEIAARGLVIPDHPIDPFMADAHT